MERWQEIWDGAGRTAAGKFRAAALLEGVRISKSDAEEFVKGQSVSQVFKAPPRSTGKVTATSENQRWQIDLVDHTKFVRSSNRNWRFILICIDVFSRRLYAEPQQDKTPGETLASFKKILAASIWFWLVPLGFLSTMS